MGILFLVRHAQASFLAPNYDQLSPLGEVQARLLGENWARHNVIFDRAGVGPCVRHKDTVNLVREAYTLAGRDFPEPLVLPEFDEYQAQAVLERSLPELLETDPAIRDLHAAFQSSCDSVSRQATFQRLFEAVVGKWVRGAIRPPGVEGWSEFCARVTAGLERFLAAGGRGTHVAIFTSGGPIAVAMRRALDLSPESTLQVSWMSRNSSWSEFLYSADRFTLSAFNTHGHIDDPAMLTYR
jgi:broad specificity phosphatase PhoE